MGLVKMLVGMFLLRALLASKTRSSSTDTPTPDKALRLSASHKKFTTKTAARADSTCGAAHRVYVRREAAKRHWTQRISLCREMHLVSHIVSTRAVRVGSNSESVNVDYLSHFAIFFPL